jgi:hypothetical protein
VLASAPSVEALAWVPIHELDPVLISPLGVVKLVLQSRALGPLELLGLEPRVVL